MHVFCGCSKLLESLRKELSLGAGKWCSLQAGFTQRLLSTHPHRVQVPVTHLRAMRARRFWTSNNSVKFTLKSRSQSSSADFSGLQRLRPAQPSLSTTQGPGIYPTPFVLPSACSDPYSQISRRQNYHTPFPYAGVFRGSLECKWNPASMGLSFRLTEHARGQPWPVGDTGVRWHYFPFFLPRDPTNTFSPPSEIVILQAPLKKAPSILNVIHKATQTQKGSLLTQTIPFYVYSLSEAVTVK